MSWLLAPRDHHKPCLCKDRQWTIIEGSPFEGRRTIWNTRTCLCTHILAHKTLNVGTPLTAWRRKYLVAVATHLMLFNLVYIHADADGRNQNVHRKIFPVTYISICILYIRPSFYIHIHILYVSKYCPVWQYSVRAGSILEWLMIDVRPALLPPGSPLLNSYDTCMYVYR